jgi:hypothetical protein
MVRHTEPRAKAFFAAATAKSTSALSPSAMAARSFPFAGLKVLKVFLLTESTHSLLIKSYEKENERE